MTPVWTLLGWLAVTILVTSGCLLIWTRADVDLGITLSLVGFLGRILLDVAMVAGSEKNDEGGES